MKKNLIYSDILLKWVPAHIHLLAQKVLAENNNNETLRKAIEQGKAKVREFEHYSAYKIGATFAPSANYGTIYPLVDVTKDPARGLTTLNRGKVGKDDFGVIYGLQLFYGETANTAPEAQYVNRKYGTNIAAAAGAQPLYVPVIVLNSDYKFTVSDQKELVLAGENFFVDDDRISAESGQYIYNLDTPLFFPGESAFGADVLPASAGAALGANACLKVVWKCCSFIV